LAAREAGQQRRRGSAAVARQRERRQHQAGNGRGQKQPREARAQVLRAPHHAGGHSHRHGDAASQFDARQRHRAARPGERGPWHGAQPEGGRHEGQSDAAPIGHGQGQQQRSASEEQRRGAEEAGPPAPALRRVRKAHEVGHQRRLAGQRGQAHGTHRLGRLVDEQQAGDRTGDHRHAGEQPARRMAEAP